MLGFCFFLLFLFRFFNIRKFYFRIYVEFTKFQSYLDQKFRSFFFIRQVTPKFQVFFFFSKFFFILLDSPFYYYQKKLYFFTLHHNNLVLQTSAHSNHYFTYFFFIIYFLNSKFKFYNFFSNYIFLSLGGGG
jgi:hypothetical protein